MPGPKSLSKTCPEHLGTKLFPLKGRTHPAVHMMFKKTGFVRSGHLLALLHGPVLILTCSLVVFLAVDSMGTLSSLWLHSPCTANCDALYALSSFCYSHHELFQELMLLPTCINWVMGAQAMTQLPFYHFWLVLTTANRTTQDLAFGDALTQPKVQIKISQVLTPHAHQELTA